MLHLVDYGHSSLPNLLPNKFGLKYTNEFTVNLQQFLYFWGGGGGNLLHIKCYTNY